MCVTNFYTDRYPDGLENHFRQLSLCPYSFNGQPCSKHEILNNVPRNIQYGEPTSAQMFPQIQVPQTPPTSSSSSHRPSSIYATEDGTASGTGTYSSGGTHRKRHQRTKSKNFLSLLGVRLESPAEKKKRKEREGRRERIVVVDEPAYVVGGSRSSSTYTRPVPGPMNAMIPGTIHYSEPSGIPYAPGPRHSATIVTQMPDTPPMVYEAFPSPRQHVTRNASPPTVKNAYPETRTVSPTRKSEREHRPRGPARPPVTIHNPRPRGRDPSPPAVYVSTQTPPPQPPATAAPIPPRDRSQSRVRTAPATPPPLRRREASRDPSRRRRERSPESSYRQPRRRDESNVRRERFSVRDEEIRNRPSVPFAPREAGTPLDVQIERERRPYVASSVVEQSRRFNDMMGGLNIRDARAAPPVVTTRPIVDGEMLGRLRERQAPLSRRNTVGGAGVERGVGERRKHRVLYDDGRERWE